MKIHENTTRRYAHSVLSSHLWDSSGKRVMVRDATIGQIYKKRKNMKIFKMWRIDKRVIIPNEYTDKNMHYITEWTLEFENVVATDAFVTMFKSGKLTYEDLVSFSGL